MRRLLAILALIFPAPVVQPALVYNSGLISAHANGAHVVSSNWSGYALQGNFREVTGTFTVPLATPAGCGQDMSEWAGIDGYSNQDLVQAGVGEGEMDPLTGDCTNALQVYAWWEILPASETPIATLTVHPGDTVTVDIVKGAAGTWDITMADDTTGNSWGMSTPYSGPATSAEWITEAPMVGGFIMPITPYGVVTYSGLVAKGRAAIIHDVWLAAGGGGPDLSVASSVGSTKALLADGFSTVYTG